jgi:hypothetical protein
VLGGAFGLTHAETHTVILPNTIAYNTNSAQVDIGNVNNIISEKKNANVAERNGIGTVHGGSGGFPSVLELQHFFEDLAGAVGGAVVYQDYFFARCGFDDAAKDLVKGGAFVVHRDDYGEFRIDECQGIVSWIGHGD